VTIGFLGVCCLLSVMADDIDPIGFAFVAFAPVSAIVDFAQYVSRHACHPFAWTYVYCSRSGRKYDGDFRKYF